MDLLVMFGKNTSMFFRNEVGTAASKCYTSCSEAYDFGPDAVKFQAYSLEFLKCVTFSEANTVYFEAKPNTSVIEHCITCCATIVNKACSFQDLTSPS